MTAASDFLEAKILDDNFVNASTFLAIFPVADVGEDDSTTGEIPVAREAATWDRSGDRVVLDADATWNDMPATTVASVAVMTAATGGHVLTHRKLTKPDPNDPTQRIDDPKTVAVGDTFSLPAGSLAITVA